MSLYVDVQSVLDGSMQAPKTAAGARRDDGEFLLYAAAVNTLVGPPESGKTLIAAAMSADQIFSGGSVLWIDLDHNGAQATIARLRSFGVPAETLVDPTRFRLALPEERDELLGVVADAAAWSPSLAVVDSLGELIPMFGANSNDADEYTDVNRRTLAALALTGCAVLAIDHEAKNDRSKSYGATGTAAKKRTIDGAYLRVYPVVAFVPGVGGKASLSIVKDRHGHLRSISPRHGVEPLVSVFELTVRDGVPAWRFTVPATLEVPEAPEADEDLRRLRALTPPPSSVRQAQALLGISTKRASAALKAYKASVAETLLGVTGNTDEGVAVLLPPRGGNTETSRVVESVGATGGIR